MREPIVINAETREITVPETERAFGVAGERKVEVKHIRIEGRTVDGTDLTQGFTWKVSCENAGKELCADLIDGIVADAGNIEFDWIVGAAPMAYKGTMHFAVCAVRVDAAGNILQEWHSKLGAGDVANGIEATVQNIGGQDLLAHIQSITAAAQQNAAAAQRDAAAAAKSAEDAATSEVNAAASAKKAQDVSDSLPADYTTAVNDIGTLKNQMQRAYPDDSTIGENPWSSKNIVDMLCPPLEESGNPVVCYPVEGYPLGVKASWEPVQEGTGTPSPENIRPIKGRDRVTVERCGENILNPKAYTSKITNGIAFTVNKDKSVRIVGTATERAVFKLYNWQDKMSFPDGNYTFSTMENLPTGTKLSIACYYKNRPVYKKNLIELSSGESSKTVSLQGIEWLDGYIDVESGYTVDTTLYPMLVRGTTVPTTYTPYIGQTNTLTLPETVYGGEVDAVTGEGTITKGCFNLDNATNWEATSYTENNDESGYGFEATYPQSPIAGDGKECWCSHLSFNWGITTGYKNTGILVHENGQVYVRVKIDGVNSVETWIAYLAAQKAAGTPVQACYKLARPVPFTATGAQAIPALAGVNTVLTDADSATVTGRADPIKRITDLEAAVASIN